MLGHGVQLEEEGAFNDLTNLCREGHLRVLPNTEGQGPSVPWDPPRLPQTPHLFVDVDVGLVWGAAGGVPAQELQILEDLLN